MRRERLGVEKGRTIAEVLGEGESDEEPAPEEDSERSGDGEEAEDAEGPGKDCGDLGEGFRASPGPREGEGR